MWTCDWCDYLNADSAKKCEICGEESSRPVIEEKPKPVLKLTIPTSIPEYKEYSRPGGPIPDHVGKKTEKIAPAEAKSAPVSEQMPVVKTSAESPTAQDLSDEILSLKLAELLKNEALEESDRIHKASLAKKKVEMSTSAPPINKTLSNADVSLSPVNATLDLSKQTIETALIVSRLVNEAREPAVFEPEIKTETKKVDADVHICFMDPDNINCIICSKPMVLSAIGDVKYPDWLPSGIDEKIELANSMIDEQIWYDILIKLNGGLIVDIDDHMEFSSNKCNGFFTEPEFPMNISLKCSGARDIQYRGPSFESLSNLCSHAIDNKRPIVLSMNLINENGESSVMFLLIQPPQASASAIKIGKIYVINPQFETCSYVDELMDSIVSNLEMPGGVHWLFLSYHYWLKSCSERVRQFFLVMNRAEIKESTRNTRLRAIIALTVASMLSAGMSISDMLATFVDVKENVINEIVDISTTRILAFMFKDIIQ